MKANISKRYYTQKPTSNDIKIMVFQEKELTIEQLAVLIQKGHAFASIFNVEGDMSIRDKKKDNFKETWYIAYDVDHNETPMEDFVKTLKIKPSISYTTYSNKENDYCFRLIYVLDEPIKSSDCFKLNYISLSHELEINNVIDFKASDCSRYFNGSSNCNIIVNTDSIINLKNIIKLSEIDIPLYISNKKDYNNIEMGCPKQTEPFPLIEYDKDIVKDFFEMDYKVFVYNYNTHESFVNYESTPLYLSEDIAIGIYPDDYIEIGRKPPYKTENHKKIKQDTRLHDHEGRRYLTTINMILRRLIYPKITFENLLYNIAWEIDRNIDNSDGQMTKNIAFGICVQVMKYDMNDFIKSGFGISKKAGTSYVNEDFCIKHGLTKKYVRNVWNSKNLSFDSIIDENYVEGMTATELFNCLKDKGIVNKKGKPISKKTCERYVNRKEDVKKYTDDEIREMIDTNLSVRGNVQFLAKLGIEIGKDKANRLKNEKLGLIEIKPKTMKKKKNNVFENDEDYFNTVKDVLANMRKRNECDNTSKEADRAIPEPSESVCAVDPTTIKVEEKEELTEEINEVKMKLYQLFEETIDKDIEEVVETFDSKFDYSILSEKELGKKLTEIAFYKIGYNDYPRYTKICDNIETVFGMEKPKSISIKKDVKEENMVRIGKYQVIPKEINDMLEVPVDALPF